MLTKINTGRKECTPTPFFLPVCSFLLIGKKECAPTLNGACVIDNTGKKECTPTLLCCFNFINRQERVCPYNVHYIVCMCIIIYWQERVYPYTKVCMCTKQYWKERVYPYTLSFQYTVEIILLLYTMSSPSVSPYLLY